MSFCPKCKYEYNEGIADCPDCGSRLVQKLHDESTPGHDRGGAEHQDIEWVNVANFSDPIEVDIAKGALQDVGIPVWVRRGSSLLGWRTRMGGSILCVPSDKVDRAKAMLEGR